MASTQQEVDRVNNERKATLEKMMEEVHDESTEGVISNDTMRGFINYLDIFSNDVAYYYESHDWSGAVVNQYPPTITRGGNFRGYFEHQGHNNNSKGGVAYYLEDRYWLVAWHVPYNKLYVKSGAKAPVDWNAIENELDASETNRCEYADPDTGIVVTNALYHRGFLSCFFYPNVCMFPDDPCSKNN